jgi:hypothetical protein
MSVDVDIGEWKLALTVFYLQVAVSFFCLVALHIRTTGHTMALFLG